MKLSDTEVYQRLIDASDALGAKEAKSVRGNTALKAARRALTLIQMGLLKAIETEPPSPPSER